VTASETLRIVLVGDEALRFWVDKADRASRQTGTLASEINRARQGARAAGINLDQIPTLNRELRMLGNTLSLPYFREAQSLLFKGRLGVRASQFGRESDALTNLSPEESLQLGLQSTIGQAALAAFVTKTVIDMIVKFTNEEKQSRADLETMIREGLDLTHDEFKALSREQIGFGSLTEQFKGAIDDAGFKEAVRETVWSVIADRISSLLPWWLTQEWIDNASLYID